MITLRRASERWHSRSSKQEVWRTFYPAARGKPPSDGFGILELLDEYRLPPGAGIPRRPRCDSDIVTYVREGRLAHEDSLQAGEFQRRTAGRGTCHREKNVSRIHWAHVFQIWLRPSAAGREPGQEQKRFTMAQRRGGLCVVASPDGRSGSLLLHEDVQVYSAVLYRGQHVVHELARSRRAWLHVVQGGLTLGDRVLTTGDGAGLTAEPAVSLTATEETEIFLLDLGEPLPASLRGLGARPRDR